MMSDSIPNSSIETSPGTPPVRVLLLDDEPTTLFLRSLALRQQGYECVATSTVEEAMEVISEIDIAVLDYHLGEGQFGTEVATRLRQIRPEVPIIILSATLEHRFGGVEDMHLLKGYSSNEDLVNALRSLEAKRRGTPVVVDAREFFYSRIGLAIGSDVLVQVLDGDGRWVYVNEAAADYLGQPREWFPDRNLFDEMPTMMRDWREIISSVATRRETYIDRSRRGLLALDPTGLNATGETGTPAWSVLAFPISLYDGRNGVVLTARLLGGTYVLPD
ncbi:CheY-like chemotaxis protein [Granulicella aggregans]|jgi:two-component system OmpR family response regulator|uniref:CheY-like chemotaxis protein n=1 Tax=Granulicella aggregans TaxID=474949 RepID=A0A7W7ZGM7_9BACT|nr:response regulator [Granulicella aggregans]MBB5059498.1 CheY-like chemotaxis protein [Granulicella aggregans]